MMSIDRLYPSRSSFLVFFNRWCTKQATKSIKMPSQCKSFCIPQFTPWFETRCTVDIDGYNNLGIHYAWESFLTLHKKMIPLWLQFPLQKMMKQWTEERPFELKVLHQMFTRRWDMGTRRYPLRHRTVTTSRHVSSLPVTPWEHQGNEVELIHYIVQRNLDNLVSKVQCQRKFFMWSVKNVASKSLEIEMRGKVNLFKFG